MKKPKAKVRAKLEGDSVAKVLNIKDVGINYPNSVYGGRAGKGEAGTFGNPFRIGIDCKNRAEAIAMHKRWFLSNQDLIALVKQQRGKNWLCFCSPSPCHCDIYLEVANS